MLRQGEGEPLVLLHGILCSELAWRNVVPLLAEGHDTIALTLLGHRGGNQPSSRPVDIAAMADDVEAQLDDLGLARVHLAGNSLGGWISFELARRGRALSVCALSPAGVWADGGDPNTERAVALLRAAVRESRRGRRFVSLGRFAAVRRRGLRIVAVHGDRVNASEFIDAAADVLGCPVADDFFQTTDSLTPLDPAPCPITTAWAGEDKIFPVDRFEGRARELIPQADFTVLDGIGHVPMYDDPQLVADTIRATTAKVLVGRK